MSQVRKEFPPDFFERRKSFHYVDFSHADFSQRSLVGVTFVDCDLSDATFAQSSLLRCVFHQVRMDRSQWDRATVAKTSIQGGSMEAANLSLSRWTEIRIERVSLAASNLEGASFEDSFFLRVNLNNVFAEEFWFTDSSMHSVTCINGQFSTSKWVDVALDPVDFSHADLSRAAFSDLEADYVNFLGANLEGVRGLTMHSGPPLSRAGMRGLKAIGTVAPETTVYTKVPAEGESAFHPEVFFGAPKYFIHTCDVNMTPPSKIKKIEGEICVSSWNRKRSPDFLWHRGPERGSGYVFRGHPTACFDADAWSEVGPDGMRIMTRVEKGDYHHDECWLIPADAELVAVVAGSKFVLADAVRKEIKELELPVLRAESLKPRAREEILRARAMLPREVSGKVKGSRGQKRGRHIAEFNPDTRMFGIYSRRAYTQPLVIGTLKALLSDSRTSSGSFGAAYGLHVSEVEARTFFNNGGRVWTGDRYYLAPIHQPMSATSMKSGGMGRVR